MKPVGVILAAGLSSRMGRPKALLPYKQTTFLGSLVAAFTAVLDRTIVVLGCHADDIRPTLPVRPGLESAFNEEYELGMLSSLQTALERIPAGSPVVFTLVDHPGLRPATLSSPMWDVRGGRCVGGDSALSRGSGAPGRGLRGSGRRTARSTDKRQPEAGNPRASRTDGFRGCRRCSGDAEYRPRPEDSGKDWARPICRLGLRVSVRPRRASRS